MLQPCLEWAHRLQALAQIGLGDARDEVQQQRYEEMRNISAMMCAQQKECFTPKMDVRGVIFHNRKILLLHNPLTKTWSLPGGVCDQSLSLADYIVQRISEEVNIVVQSRKLLALLHHDETYKAFIECNWHGETLPAQSQFFSVDELPSALAPGDTTREQLALMFSFLENPVKSAVFD